MQTDSNPHAPTPRETSRFWDTSDPDRAAYDAARTAAPPPGTDPAAIARAEARGVRLVGIDLSFDDVFRLVLLVFLAQLLLTGILGAFAAALYVVLR